MQNVITELPGTQISQKSGAGSVCTEEFDERFVTLLEDCLPKLRSRAMRFVRNHALADDLVQIACLKAWNARHSFDLSRSMLKWMTRVMKNAMIDEFRSTQRRSEIIISVNLEDLQARSPNPTPIQDEMIDLVKAMNDLNDDERQIILMRLIVGLSHQQIGTKLNTSTANARKIFSRALKKLQAACDASNIVSAREMPRNADTAFESLRKQAFSLG